MCVEGNLPAPGQATHVSSRRMAGETCFSTTANPIAPLASFRCYIRPTPFSLSRSYCVRVNYDLTLGWKECSRIAWS